mmetsp:Transcript_19515/g.29991  ORF Transcript_19515/g.29991 Transcript_19515/m.29991 type:complete len:85 (+) Transcript_19515:134-388(+)
MLKAFITESLTTILQYRKLKPPRTGQTSDGKSKKWNLEEHLQSLEHCLGSGDRTFRINLLIYISDGANRVLAEKWVYEIIHFPP